MDDLLAPYRGDADRMRPRVEAVLAGAQPVPACDRSTIAWVAVSLIGGDREVMDIPELLFRMDGTNKLLASADEVAGGLLALQERGWLVHSPDGFALTGEIARELRGLWERDGLHPAWKAFEKKLDRD